MKEYLKMSDVFDGLISVSGETIDNFTYYGICGSNHSYYAKFDVNGKAAKYTAHAINSHDELVAEVERLRGMVQDAFIEGCHAGWDMSGEGYNAEHCAMDDGAIHDMFVQASMEYSKGA